MKNKRLTPDELWVETGAMFSRVNREEVSPCQGRARFRLWLQAKAAGESPQDLSPETVVALGEDGDDPRMPAKYAKLLGLKRGAHYGDVFNARTQYALKMWPPGYKPSLGEAKRKRT